MSLSYKTILIAMMAAVLLPITVHSIFPLPEAGIWVVSTEDEKVNP
jgi:hypothetical protein